MSGKSVEKLFPIVKPYGYKITDVNDTIAKYNDVIDKMKTIIIEYQVETKNLKRSIKKLVDEKHKLCEEMSLMEVPDMSPSEEFMLLTQFKNQSEKIDNKAANIEYEAYNEGIGKNNMPDNLDIGIDNPNTGSNEIEIDDEIFTVIQ